MGVNGTMQVWLSTDSQGWRGWDYVDTIFTIATAAKVQITSLLGSERVCTSRVGPADRVDPHLESLFVR